MNKIGTMEQAIHMIKEGSRVMIPGFLGCGTPEGLVDKLVEKGTKNLVIIANDTAYPDTGVGKLIVNKQIKELITCHIGTNRETGRQMHAGEIEVELVPLGTFAERIRAGGAGLGGILTPTGVGTVVEEGKKVIEINGKKYLLELPLKADFALLKARKADKFGNLIYDKTARNHNPLMAMAADYVIAEADEIVEIGELDPENVMTPGIFVDMVVQGGKQND